MNFRSCYNSRPLNLTPNVMQTSSTWYMHGLFKYKFGISRVNFCCSSFSPFYVSGYSEKVQFITLSFCEGLISSLKSSFFIYTFLVLIVLDLNISILKPRFPLVSIIKCKMRKKKAIKKQWGQMNFSHQYLIHKMVIFVFVRLSSIGKFNESGFSF